MLFVSDFQEFSKIVGFRVQWSKNGPLFSKKARRGLFPQIRGEKEARYVEKDMSRIAT